MAHRVPEQDDGAARQAVLLGHQPAPESYHLDRRQPRGSRSYLAGERQSPASLRFQGHTDGRTPAQFHLWRLLWARHPGSTCYFGGSEVLVQRAWFLQSRGADSERQPHCLSADAEALKFEPEPEFHRSRTRHRLRSCLHRTAQTDTRTRCRERGARLSQPAIQMGQGRPSSSTSRADGSDTAGKELELLQHADSEYGAIFVGIGPSGRKCLVQPALRKAGHTAEDLPASVKRKGGLIPMMFESPCQLHNLTPCLVQLISV